MSALDDKLPSPRQIEETSRKAVKKLQGDIRERAGLSREFEPEIELPDI